jgi:predicted Rossmann fold flavoprotein
MDTDTLILGAGAAGLYAAGLVPDALVLDHASRPAEKVRISGGGRCNFTNLHTAPSAFLSRNPHFAKSALASHTAQDFLRVVEAHRIPWHQKTLGQLFCDRSSKDIIALLLAEVARAGAEVRLSTALHEVSHDGARFVVETEAEGRRETLRAKTLVVATGGKSIPKMGATGAAYRIAERFGLPVTRRAPRSSPSPSARTASRPWPASRSPSRPAPAAPASRRPCSSPTAASRAPPCSRRRATGRRARRSR